MHPPTIYLTDRSFHNLNYTLNDNQIHLADDRFPSENALFYALIAMIIVIFTLCT
jgi:hypothetical protein